MRGQTKGYAFSGNRTRVWPVAGAYSTTRPRMPLQAECFVGIAQFSRSMTLPQDVRDKHLVRNRCHSAGIVHPCKSAQRVQPDEILCRWYIDLYRLPTTQNESRIHCYFAQAPVGRPSIDIASLVVLCVHCVSSTQSQMPGGGTRRLFAISLQCISVSRPSQYFFRPAWPLALQPTAYPSQMPHLHAKGTTVGNLRDRT